ncbi:hypothetical protein EWM64_g5599 [Hericium alpestre]|uniref:Ubiquinol-cytochrome C reductase hinge domain-containing protein n=1 Tax=Hericium alpestre TaxID=135208 RepID=A0A4Y9ZW73_9AGAM|nr:hypothetical protein EWM64_g5599 [Hericium alpestre]
MAFFSSFFALAHNDSPQEEPEENKEEVKEPQAEEEEEEEPEDPHPALREECQESAKCKQFTEHFQHCQEKVQSGQGFKGEDCVEELRANSVSSTSSLDVFGTGVYSSSETPASLPWNTYNYCNAPHVNAKHYAVPNEAHGSELVYLNVMIRHHKRTPDNLYPTENVLNPPAGWNCTNFMQFNYGGGGANVFHNIHTPPTHPFISQIWNGTCDEGQLTEDGLRDGIRHGQDFWGVYHTKLGFLHQWPAVCSQPTQIDSLVPNYACPGAGAIRNAYQSVPAWTDHLQQNAALKARLDATLGTAGLADWASWCPCRLLCARALCSRRFADDHFFDTFTSRTCNGHPLPCNATGACVSDWDADTVHAIGDFEYNYIWNTAENATAYNQLTFGVMFGELAQNMVDFAAGRESHKLRFYVGHDGSMIRLASGLGLGKAAPLRWPAMGSEVVMEVWKTPQESFFVRVLHEGSLVDALRWVPLDRFTALLQSQVPDNIFVRVLKPFYCHGDPDDVQMQK